MSTTHPGPIKRVVLATDLGADSVDLFAHGLALALRANAQLYLVHMIDDNHPEASWRRLPTVRALLERWGALAPAATHGEFEALGIRVHPLEYRPVDGDLQTALARRVSELKPDLLMLGTHVRSWFDQVARPSVSEPVARDVHKATLFISDHARGIVDPETGLLRLRRVLVPITSNVPQQPLIDELQRLLESFGAGAVQFIFVHIGSDDTLPSPTLPTRTDWVWKTDRRSGLVVEQILAAEVEHEVDIIAMATYGHDSWLDELRGSTMERVLHRANSPIFAVPVSSKPE